MIVGKDNQVKIVLIAVGAFIAIFLISASLRDDGGGSLKSDAVVRPDSRDYLENKGFKDIRVTQLGSSSITIKLTHKDGIGIAYLDTIAKWLYEEYGYAEEYNICMKNGSGYDCWIIDGLKLGRYVRGESDESLIVSADLEQYRFD